MICSVQRIFSTLPHFQISKASGLFISFSLIAHVWSIQQETTLQCFYNLLIKISVSQDFSHFWECPFSYRYPPFSFSVRFGISCNHIPYRLYSRICSYYYIFLFIQCVFWQQFSFLCLSSIFFSYWQIFSFHVPLHFVQCIRYCLKWWSLTSCDHRLVGHLLIFKRQCLDKSSSSLIPIPYCLFDKLFIVYSK